MFCAAHFITYDGGHCERLHGHNYRMTCTVSGPLDDNQYVFDFIALKNKLKSMADSWDHHMLVAEQHPLIRCEATDQQVTLRFEQRTWSFPREDCILLPLKNTTTELLAKQIGEQLLTWLRSEKNFMPDSLTIELDESLGQSASYEWRT